MGSISPSFSLPPSTDNLKFQMLHFLFLFNICSPARFLFSFSSGICLIVVKPEKAEPVCVFVVKLTDDPAGAQAFAQSRRSANIREEKLLLLLSGDLHKFFSKLF